MGSNRHGEETERAVLTFVRDFSGQHGYAPTTREIAAAVGLRSAVGVKAALGRLQDKGMVTVAPGVTRGIVVTMKGRRAR